MLLYHTCAAKLINGVNLSYQLSYSYSRPSPHSTIIHHKLLRTPSLLKIKWSIHHQANDKLAVYHIFCSPILYIEARLLIALKCTHRVYEVNAFCLKPSQITSAVPLRKINRIWINTT